MGWWDQKLGGTPAAPRPAPVAPANLPTGLGVDHGRVIDHYMDRRTAPPSQPRPEFVPNTTGDATKVAEVLPIWQWEGNPNGGAGETARTGNCPGCGSPRYFSGQYENGTGGHMDREGRMVYPMAGCADCGYPRQQGILGTDVKLTGSSIQARGTEAVAPPGSLASLRPH